jgi:hypothetical protein
LEINPFAQLLLATVVQFGLGWRFDEAAYKALRQWNCQYEECPHQPWYNLRLWTELF